MLSEEQDIALVEAICGVPKRVGLTCKFRKTTGLTQLFDHIHSSFCLKKY